VRGDPATRWRTAASAVVALATVGAVPAIAATPSSGQVSHAQPKLVWKGNASGAAFVPPNSVLGPAGYPIVCEPTACDVFTLEVVDSADLHIESSSCADPVTQVEVERPDGSRVVNNGFEDSPRTVIDLRAAPVGTYIVRTIVNAMPSQPSAYIGHASLSVPELTTMSVTDVSITSRHAHRGARITVPVSVSAGVSAIRALLRGHGRVVGTGLTARVEDRGKVQIRLTRSLGPGRYTVRVAGRDDSGAVIAGRSVIRVTRHQTGHTSRAAAAAPVADAAVTPC
jgi:hypothetical protein